MPRLPCIALLPLLAACGSDSFATVKGEIDGEAFRPTLFYWGGPYIVFSTQDGDCMDAAWVRRGPAFQTDDEAPVDTDMTAVLFTYDAEEVAAGDFSVEGDAPIDARVIRATDGVITVFRATAGGLVVDPIDEAEAPATGSFELIFDEGTLSGDFEVEWCNNMKDRN